ncbi:MAG: branched-chain amino acid ABC transporter permease [Deltaproteobacteria bacterium]|nr:branched-chain amino acid ABC transporter permease [Deltaproteobacteria bacterium]
MSEFFQHLVNGLSLGTIYALIALGYTMVYGVLKLINFAHADVFMIGAYTGLFSARAIGGEGEGSYARAGAVLVISMLVSAGLGMLIERLAYRPLRARPRLTALITAIGVSFFLENGAQLLWSPDPRRFPRLFESHTFFLGNTAISSMQIIAFLVAVAMMAGLQYLVFRTRFGLAMRAVSFEPSTAALMGVPVDRTISITFAVGSALAAGAAILFGLQYPRVEPFMGLMLGLKAFVAAVLGGIGNVPGSMVGGLVLGLAEEFVAGYGLSSYRDAVAFAILIAILILRPEGIFGRSVAEKV